MNITSHSQKQTTPTASRKKKYTKDSWGLTFFQDISLRELKNCTFILQMKREKKSDN